MFCRKCGNIINDNSQNCPKCGVDFDKIDIKIMNEYDRENQRRLQKELKRLEKKQKKQLRTKKQSVFSILKILLVTITSLLLIILLTTISAIYYFNTYQFDNEFNYISTEVYMKKNNLDIIDYNENKEMTLILSEDLVNSFVYDNIKIIEERIIDKYKIKNYKLNLEKRRIDINLIYSDLLVVPISAQIDINVVGEKLELELKEFVLGTKNIKIPKLLVNYIEEKYTKYTLDKNILPKLINMKRVEFIDKKIKLYTTINKEELSKNIIKYIKEIDTLILDMYEEIEDIKLDRQLIEQIINNSSITGAQQERLFEDFFGEQEYIEDILVLLNHKTTRELFSKYREFIKNSITEEKIMNKKNEYLIDKKIELSRELLKNLEDYQYINNIYLLYDYGKLFDYRNKQYIKVKEINDYYQTIHEKYSYNVDETDFFYDYDREQILIKHKLNSKQYLIVSNSGYEIKSEAELLEIYPEKKVGEEAKLINKENIQREEIINSIKQDMETSEEVYIRYLKSDGRSAYGVISLQYRYQDIYKIALIKEDTKWKVINRNSTYQNLNRSHSEFNIKTLPDFEIDSIYIKYMTSDGKEVIRQEFINKKIYKNLSEVHIIFCTFIEDYIYAKLDNGKEYVIKENGGKLEEILSVEEAKSKWQLPELLLLQE